MENNILSVEATSDEYVDARPLFSTRSFEISVFSSHPEGLEFDKGELLPRPDAKNILLSQGDYGEAILSRIVSDIKSREVPSALKAATEGSLETAQEKARLALIEEVFNPSPDQIEDYKRKLQEGKLTNYALLSGGDIARLTREYEGTHKFGMFDIKTSVDGRKVRANIRKVPFVFYKHIRKPEDEANGLIELANPTGVAVVVETNDGYFGLGRRGSKNGSYRASDEGGGQPGAFAAGIMDMNFSRLTPPGLPENLQNVKVMGAAGKELKEETGVEFLGKNFEAEVRKYAIQNIKKETGVEKDALSDTASEDLESKLKITCIGRDKIAPHNEIGLTLSLPASRESLIAIHAGMERNESEKDFSEDIFFIPANKEAVTKFVTECKTPMPPTHYLPLISAMYEKLITQGDNRLTSKNEANDWLQSIEKGIDSIWKDIDEMVESFYVSFPEAVDENKKECKRDDINTHGFDPVVLADKQGLPTLNEELDRLGFPQLT